MLYVFNQRFIPPQVKFNMLPYSLDSKISEKKDFVTSPVILIRQQSIRLI